MAVVQQLLSPNGRGESVLYLMVGELKVSLLVKGGLDSARRGGTTVVERKNFHLWPHLQSIFQNSNGGNISSRYIVTSTNFSGELF